MTWRGFRIGSKECRRSTVNTSKERPRVRDGGSAVRISAMVGRTGVSVQAEAQLLQGLGWLLVLTLLACSVDRPAEPPVLPRQAAGDPDCTRMES